MIRSSGTQMLAPLMTANVMIQQLDSDSYASESPEQATGANFTDLCRAYVRTDI